MARKRSENTRWKRNQQPKKAIVKCVTCDGTGWEVPHPDYRVCRQCKGSGKLHEDGTVAPETLTKGWEGVN